MKINIALIGFGTVGQGFVEILLQKKTKLSKYFGLDYEIVAIADFAYGNIYNPEGISPTRALKAAKEKQKFLVDVTAMDTLTLIKECNADVVCELTYTDLFTGGPAINHVRAALTSGKHVITSNKGPAALKYNEFNTLAESKGVKFLIEGTVMAGTPVIKLASEQLRGCKINKAMGILNGTTNFILTEMEKGLDYASALKIAQEKGYAEADPTGDVEGYDARGKVTIVANVIMKLPVKLNEISCKGITGISSEDIKSAKEQGKRWKLIGSVEKKDGFITASVAPQMIALDHPLAGVSGANNAITFSTDLLGDITIVGPGAGKSETGFSILSDLLTLV